MDYKYAIYNQMKELGDIETAIKTKIAVHQILLELTKKSFK